MFGSIKNNKINNGVNSIDNNNINNINNKKIEIVTFKKTPDGYCEDVKWVNVGIYGKIEDVES